MYKGYKIIALCIAKVNDERNFMVLKVLNHAANMHGFKLLVYHTCSDLYSTTVTEEGEKTVFELIDYSITDGIIFFDESFMDKDILHDIENTAMSNNIPVVLIGAERDNCINFVFDYRSGYEKVVRHVVEDHGVKSVHIIGGRRNDWFSDERISVAKKVLEENGIPFNNSMVSYGDYWQDLLQRL